MPPVFKADLGYSDACLSRISKTGHEGASLGSGWWSHLAHLIWLHYSLLNVKSSGFCEICRSACNIDPLSRGIGVQN
jgi:hypothetical protein